MIEINSDFEDYLQAQFKLLNGGLDREQSYIAQANLQKLTPLFDESSCELWQGAYENKLLFFKVALDNEVSPFWLMMQSLFTVTLPCNLMAANDVFKVVAQQNSLLVPQLYSISASASASSFVSPAIAVADIGGCSAIQNKLSHQSVIKLANYLAQLHNQSFDGFGSLASTQFDKDANNLWNKKLNQLFSNFIELGLPAYEANQQLDEKPLPVAKYVPVMMDLRWDQFAIEDGVLMGVYDLDAYVAAPVELDFVMLEYLLDKQQLDVFVEAYSKQKDAIIPNIDQVRSAYRHLFFIVNALGESDYQKWQSHPTYF